MHNAQLHLGFGKYRLNRLRQAFEPVDTGNEAILDPAVVLLREDRQPEFGPLALTEPQP